MKLPKINWTNRIANYNMAMQELVNNDFRPSKQKQHNNCYYWKYNPDLLVHVNIETWIIHNPNSHHLASIGSFTVLHSVDKFRDNLKLALQATPKRFPLNKAKQ